ncbi:hypothetical protein B0H13DRAFT_1897096 [Mycena leptocephala]|nr:hypothetical protein B0H13DRAFT_1897096 [Mycena leptocephala]
MPITYARQHFIPTANIPSCFKHFALVLVGACVPGRIASFCRSGTCPGKIFTEPRNCYQMYCPKALGNSMLSRSKPLKLLRWPGTQSQIIVHSNLQILDEIAVDGTGDGAEDDCVHDKIHKFNKNSNQSVLIVWDSTDMEYLIESVDTDAGLDNDSLGLHADLILTVNPGNLKSVGESSMNCTGSY